MSQYCRTTASIWRSWSPTCAPSRTATSPCTTGCAQTNWPAVEASSTCAPRRGESKGSKLGQIPASSQLYLIFPHFHLYFLSDYDFIEIGLELIFAAIRLEFSPASSRSPPPVRATRETPASFSTSFAPTASPSSTSKQSCVFRRFHLDKRFTEILKT